MDTVTWWARKQWEHAAGIKWINMCKDCVWLGKRQKPGRGDRGDTTQQALCVLLD